MKKNYTIEFDSKDNYEMRATCPVCGFDFTHIADVNYSAGYGNRGDMLSTKQGGVSLSMEGECGHQWTLWFGEHKGNVFTAWERKEDMNEYINDNKNKQ